MKVCVFASSMTTTNPRYLALARSLGELLGANGHLCINGGGKFGCMGALNEGCKSANGKVRSVIHNKWVIDKHEFKDVDELIVAHGDNLQERKRLLYEECDCVIVLPGGAGTFDEVWDVACHNSVGFGKIPITLINIDGYYEGFIKQLERAKLDGMLYGEPDDILHVEETAEAALAWCQKQYELADTHGSEDLVIQARNTTLIFKRRHSFLLGMAVGALASLTLLAMDRKPVSSKWVK